MVRSFGSNNYIPSNKNCGTGQISWFSNLFILFHPFSSFFILFHPFSSKKAEKGRKRQKKAGTGRDTSFALENLKPDKKSFTKKANLFETKNGNLLSWSSLPVHV
jgi:hypothetical protein